MFTETAGGRDDRQPQAHGEQGIIGPDEETVAYVTGNGYKTIEALEGFLEPSYNVAPDLDEFLAALNACVDARPGPGPDPTSLHVATGSR